MKSSKSNLSIENLPQHVAFIMDGNGRWAKKRLLPRKAGHHEGVKTIHRIVNDAFDIGIKYVTLYAFSTENKARPQEEIDALFQLMKDNFSTLFAKLMERDISLHFMGDISYFPQELQNIITDAAFNSKDFKRGVLNIAMNYGARDEILRAVNLAIEGGEKLSLQQFNNLLYTSEIPDPDIIIRTSGEMRLSNFMLYQAAYSELFFTKTLWPDFNKNELCAILEEYANRNRRFGKV